MSDDKECFFIAPIDEEGSEARQRSDDLMEYIVTDVVEDFGYSIKRADQLEEPGSITSQVIQKTINSELVIADLTGHNPNVFYELAIRHATGKPFIQLIEVTDTIPFDVFDVRTVKYGLDVEKADQARTDIRSHLESVQDGNVEFDNPISKSGEMRSLEESKDPVDQNLAEVLQRLSNIDSKISNMENTEAGSETPSPYELGDFEGYSLDIDGETFEFPVSQISLSEIEMISDTRDITREELKELARKQGFDIISR